MSFHGSPGGRAAALVFGVSELLRDFLLLMGRVEGGVT